MPLFESQTPEVIRDRILSGMGSELQTREGSYAYNLASPVAFEIWRVLMTLDELVYAFYVTKDSGPWLDLNADLLAMVRRGGTKATAVIHFTGRDGVIIPAGTQFYTVAGLEFLLVYDVTLKDGGGTGSLQAAAAGDNYNVDAGEIVRILRNISGLESWTHEDAVGGTDPESDVSLFERIDFRRKRPATSGNENHYIEWARECDGVGAVKVQRLWDGPGTVRVVIVGDDGRPVDDVVVANCAAYIETKRPVGAEVTVVSAQGMNINVSAAVTLNGTTTLETVRSEFVAQLDNYLLSLGFEETVVYYTKIGALLSSVDGVIDYDDLLVNGGTDNVAIDWISVPVSGEVTLT